MSPLRDTLKRAAAAIQTLAGARMVAVSTPPMGAFWVYQKAADGLIYAKKDTGVEVRLDGVPAATAAAAGSMSAAAFSKVESLASAAFGGVASTTNATVTTCGFYQMADNQTAVVTVTVAAHRDNHTQGAGYVMVGAFRRSGGTVTQIGVTTVLSAREDNVAWDAILNISGTTVRVRVTGAAAVNIAWRSTAVVTVA